jgi:biuret amidohydrolase
MLPPVHIKDRSDYKRRMNDALVIDPRRAAVLTIDMQNDYLDLSVASLPVAQEEASRVLTHARKLLGIARSLGIPVVHAYVKRRPLEVDYRVLHNTVIEASQRARLTQNAQGAPARTRPDRVDGTPQAEVPEVLVAPSDFHVTTKRVLDAFHGTDLDALIGQILNVKTVILAGINTDTCIYSTVFAAGNRGYQPVVISDCVASMRGIDQHWMALELMARSAAWVMTVGEIEAKLRQTARIGSEAALT